MLLNPQGMRETFAKEMSPIVGHDIKVMESAELAVKDADIVLAATNAIVPVLNPEWIEKGMHLSTIKPGEFSPDVVRKADIAATLMEDCDPVFITSHGLQVPEEPGGELQNLANEVGWKGLVTLPELLLEQKPGRNVNPPRRGRTSDDQVTCFESARARLSIRGGGIDHLQACQGARPRPRSADRLVHRNGDPISTAHMYDPGSLSLSL